MSKGKLLIVDDEKVALKNLEHVMKKEGYEVIATQSGANALAHLAKQPFDVVLTDLRMEKVDGMQVLRKCRESGADTEVVLITGYATLESAVEAMKHGAFYYIAKPFRLDEVRKVVAEAMEKLRLRRENRVLREQVENFQGKVRIITQDAEMQRLLDMARQIAPTDCNVLITGESGTGKELFAHYLHHHSHRTEKAFLAVNCGAFNEELLANELFGHVKGAFTGAVAEKKGLLLAADGGTLFLDEITEMSPAMQVKLLRVIQEREVLPLGATQPAKADVRFIAATNRDVPEMVKSGAFRQDLYFRLNVVNLQIPSLASRREDVPLLAYHFLKKCAARMGKPVTEIGAEAMSLLKAYDFPGNVRELENIVERGVAIAGGDTIETASLPDDLRDLAIRTFRKKEGRLPSLEEQERDYIRWVLAEAGGNQTLAAQILGIDRVSLWRKLKRYQLEMD
ncbi:Fis family transcriptional regulator [Candidatus Desulfobacillus denitrificans]|jgi:DNA-binding NtrC family response regulator|uniref:Fis family transcriptional regulator n=1 Tax=Candidatus Desulfobacillus denitrificans TaxID=2608985 RepID=A0A809QXF5_9PROT|nr:sigma-54 dependent transcriptional regulator [Rhodocyclaceae bacterium]BBO20110.1 Fis family transcriptional regulator [Candidatus Desulfobacillus denitrificans]